MKRSIEGSRRSRDCSIDINPTRGQMPSSSSRTIHLMLSVQHEKNVHHSREARVGPVAPVPHRIKHVKKIFCVGQTAERRDGGPACHPQIHSRCNRRHLAQNSHNLLVSNRSRIVQILAAQCRIGIVMERGKRTNPDHEHSHGVSIVRQSGNDLQHALGHRRVLRNGKIPRRHLRPSRQFSIHEQITHFRKAALLGELLDRVTPVPQNPSIPIDVRNRRSHGSRVQVPRIVHSNPEPIASRRDLQELRRPDSPPGTNFKLILLSRPPINHLQLPRYSSSSSRRLVEQAPIDRNGCPAFILLRRKMPRQNCEPRCC
ncbi:hypothetical protein Mapa_012134 [Marchantia paleacea]|nr:hypothetical protein Mapa_012134 [Marchantia paleacea]